MAVPWGPAVTLRVWVGTHSMLSRQWFCLFALFSCSPPGLRDTLWPLRSAWVRPNPRSGQRHGPQWLDIIPTLSPWLELMAQPSHVPALMWPEALQTLPGSGSLSPTLSFPCSSFCPVQRQRL